MGKESPKPPPVPDPKATAEAQGNMNQITATQQQLLNMIDQFGPDGSLTYEQTGENTFIGPDGKTYTVPKFKATTSLSEAGQLLNNTNNRSRQNLADAGVTASGKINSILGTNVDLSNDAVENRLFQLGTARLNPQFERDDASLRAKLINSGIRPGSDAWNTEMTRQGQNKNDALNSLLLGGHQTAVNDILTERNQPLNEIIGLMSGSQVQQPGFTNTPQASVAGTDYAGMVRDQYNAQNEQYKAQLGQQNALMGGLFGLGGALGGAGIKALSDRRAKKDIERVGRLDNGLPVYRFTYKGDNVPQIGLMADDVEKVHPSAVEMGADGFKRVDYAEAVRA